MTSPPSPLCRPQLPLPGKARVPGTLLDLRDTWALGGVEIGVRARCISPSSQVRVLRHVDIVAPHHHRLTSTRAPRSHGTTPHGQPAARSKAFAPPEAFEKDTRANGHGAVKAGGPMPLAAIGTMPPTPHTRLTSTRAPRPHGTPQEQPVARSEAPAPFKALAKTPEQNNMMR